MRSFIFCTTYFQKRSEIKNYFKWNVVVDVIEHYRCRMRLNRWLKYYSERKELFGAERIFLIDDGSPIEDININVTIVSVEDLPETLPSGIVMFRFKEHLGRQSLREFPGWWRSFSFASKIQDKYYFDKIIHIESDAFVVSEKLSEYIKGLRSGWTGFFCPLYNFPETAIQIICKDSVPELRKIWESGVEFWRQGMLAEFTLPFTEINRQFIGDRYREISEDYATTFPEDADYICQAHSLMIFHDKLKNTNIKPTHWMFRKITSVCKRYIYKSLQKVVKTTLNMFTDKSSRHR